MRFNWAHGIAISDAMGPMRNGRFRQRVKGRWAGPSGATAGVKGGRPEKASPEEKQRMNECLDAGMSERQTAIAVFGDPKYRGRVRSFLGS
jgi:hypothetical protein